MFKQNKIETGKEVKKQGFKQIKWPVYILLAISLCLLGSFMLPERGIAAGDGFV